MIGALNKSLHGRPIVVTDVNPSVEIIHQVPGTTFGIRHAHRVHLELSNSGASSVVGEVHYNNGAMTYTIPAKTTIAIDMVCEGDSPSCFVANADLAVSLASGESGQINVAGYWSTQ